VAQRGHIRVEYYRLHDDAGSNRVAVTLGVGESQKIR
jgi:hypothetical protein